MSEGLLDTTYDIATPEGVELKLPVAGFAPRCLAWMIDAIIKYTGLLVASIISNLAGDFGTGVLLIAAFLLLWFYNVLFEVLANGATPGKKVLGLRVMNVDGTPVGWSGSIIRNLIRFIDVLPGAYFFGMLSIMLTDKMQRLGDLAGDTIVIYQPSQPARGELASVAPTPLKLPMTPDEQKALVSFGERATLLNQDRANELARIVAPIMNDASANTLRSYAAWIVGRSRDE